MQGFGRDFLWGAATSAFQFEGAAREDGKAPSIWDDFARTPGKMHGGATGDTACDHYRRYLDDVALMRELNLRAYRFSISWPRVMPDGRGGINETGLGFYDRLVDALCEAGIEPFATLYHWDLPSALQNQLGGWASEDIPRIFADYAQIMFDRLGDRVKYWLTLNEPWCVVDGGYFNGVHAPGLRDTKLGYRVGHNLMRAHAYAVQRYRASKSNGGAISLALNSPFCYPASERNEDRKAAQRVMEGFAGWFGDPACFGDYPAIMRERLGDLLPEFSEEDSALLRGSMDFITLNYYFSDVVEHAPGEGPMDARTLRQPDRRYTEMDWPIVPEGLCDLLVWLADRYPGLPMYIAENGAALVDEPEADGFVDDQERIAYLRDHIAAIAEARRRGVDVRGYLLWSLMDNLEWSMGFSKRFGIVRCDFDTQQRTIKASGRWYADMIRRATGAALASTTTEEGKAR